MAKYVEVTVRVPVREALQRESDETFNTAARIVTSGLNNSNSLMFNTNILVDSLAEVVDVKVVEE